MFKALIGLNNIIGHNFWVFFVIGNAIIIRNQIFLIVKLGFSHKHIILCKIKLQYVLNGGMEIMVFSVSLDGSLWNQVPLFLFLLCFWPLGNRQKNPMQIVQYIRRIFFEKKNVKSPDSRNCFFEIAISKQ